MLTLGHSTKLYMCRKPVDFRYGFDGLANLCKKMAGKDPYNGSVFLFFNRSMTKAKLIYFDGTGSVMIWKRLEQGKYKLPKTDENEEFPTLRGTDAALLLEGVDASKIKRGKAWKPVSNKDLN
ncbi:IS66 family insertion sequence element accessory protein TnpB [Pseudobacteriovorax antillogorgiicola]|uniref:Transposase n=1 Tax=Pseudobacteriovorax antillogorgiicola TaxID=1513793 RepID=A0A1Y6CQG0_9BACT|nr:IS66 family insertion sequence element accessory protein TnpB [Pseudobacteriovorax antillogorgiicola]TCS41570.1 transposase [Pseudobacteriovorax antillogorgiicola]SMF83340.1 transposase [Pseudobacteriovorax antillogorgiicola]